MSVCVWWTGGKLLNITSVCSFNRFLYQMWLFRTLQQQNVSSVWFLSERECDMWVEHLWSWAWCRERISWNEFPFTGCPAQPEETRLSGGAQRRTAAPNVERRQLKQFSIFSGRPRGSSLWRCSGHIQQRGGSRSDTAQQSHSESDGMLS